MTGKIQLPKMPSFRIDGKHALITGAGRGIGRAAAAALANAGAEVTLAARSSDEIEAVLFVGPITPATNLSRDVSFLDT